MYASGLRLNHANQIGSLYGSVVTGEVENTSARTLESVRVMLDQLDAAGNVLGSTTAFALAERLDPGERTAFKGYLLPLPGFVNWNVRNVVGDFAIKPANHNFTLAVTGSYLDEYGFRHIEGTVRNDNTGPASAVTVNAQFFDGAATTDAEWTYPDSDLTMAPGEVAPFEIMRVDGVPHTSVVLSADANNDPSPLPTVVSVSGGGSTRHDRQVEATGRVVKRGTDVGVAGVHVEMHTYSAYSRQWVVSGGGATDANGTVRVYTPPQRHNTTVRLRVPATDKVSASESGTVFTTVTPALSLQGSRDLQIGGGAVLSFQSAYSGTVEIQRKDGKKWVKVGTKKLKKHRIATSQKPPYQYHYIGWAHPPVVKVGKVQFRVVLPATALNGTGVSNVFTAKVIGL